MADAKLKAQTEIFKPDRLLRLLLGWTAVTTLPFWLVSVRGAFDGLPYEWSWLGFSGQGISTDYWFPLLGASLALLTRCLGWRGAKLPFHILLLGWHGFLAASILLLAITIPEDFRLRGDTLGIDVSLVIIGPLVFGAWAMLAAIWVVRDLLRGQQHNIPSWSARNRAWLLGLVMLLPVQFVLLRFGTPDGIADVIGVLLTMAQWLLLGFVFSPRISWQASAEIQTRSVA